jgi:hypothetical protein
MLLDGGDGSKLSFDGTEVMEKAFSLGWSPDSSGFKELPLVEPSLHINISVISDELFLSFNSLFSRHSKLVLLVIN